MVEIEIEPAGPELARQNIWDLRKRFRLLKRNIDRQHAAIAEESISMPCGTGAATSGYSDHGWHHEHFVRSTSASAGNSFRVARPSDSWYIDLDAAVLDLMHVLRK